MSENKEILLNEEISNDVYNCKWRYGKDSLYPNRHYKEHDYNVFIL